MASQGYEKDRSIEETLDVGWELLRTMPDQKLKRVKKRLPRWVHDEVAQ